MFSNPLLLWGIAFQVGLAAVFIYAPPMQALLGTAARIPAMVALLLPFPVVWGADEIRHWLLCQRRATRSA